jgi:RHS repeat-associated protein
MVHGLLGKRIGDGYNKHGRLDRLTIGSTVTADYTYDGLERLAIRATQNMTPAGTTHYVYDLAGHLIAESTDTGQTVREYVWLDDMPLAVVADVDTMSPKLWHVHADQLDRPLKMTDGTQAVVWDAVYRPFGEVVSITGSGSNNLRFPGQYFLIESGLHYNWHRHYDPSIGRYLQTDPLGTTDGPSVYAYTQNSPTMFVDRLGLAVGDWWDLVANFRRAYEIGIEELARRSGPGSHNNSVDAMRHAVWMCRTVRETNRFTAWVAGVGHEMNWDQPLSEMLMDLHNNAVGRDAGINNAPINVSKLWTAPPSGWNNPYRGVR